MKHITIRLQEFFPIIEDVILEGQIIENYPEINPVRKHQTILVFPGGGYSFTSEREADPIAYSFLLHDISVFILRYKTQRLAYPSQLLQAAAALSYIRSHAKAWNIDEHQIYAMGFSAGGHLCGNLATLKADDAILQTLSLSLDDVKLNGMILCYPCITLDDKRSVLSPDFIQDEELYQTLAIDQRVTPSTPKAFIWHTFNDELVTVNDSLVMANALKHHHVPFELHIFSDGPHGLATCDVSSNHETSSYNREDLKSWIPLCIEWLKRN